MMIACNSLSITNWPHEIRLEQLVAEGEIPSAGEAILRSLIDAHIRHAAWCDQRAREFAETRQLEFRRPIGRPRDVDPGDPGALEGDPLPDAPSDAPETSGAVARHARAAPVLAEPGRDDAVDAPDGSSTRVAILAGKRKQRKQGSMEI